MNCSYSDNIVTLSENCNQNFRLYDLHLQLIWHDTETKKPETKAWLDSWKSPQEDLTDKMSFIIDLIWLDDSHMASRWGMAAIELVQEGLAGGMPLFNKVDAVHREILL
jgi:hypothetical protein